MEFYDKELDNINDDITKMYFYEIGQYPLLSNEEEYELL